MLETRYNFARFLSGPDGSPRQARLRWHGQAKIHSQRYTQTKKRNTTSPIAIHWIPSSNFLAPDVAPTVELNRLGDAVNEAEAVTVETCVSVQSAAEGWYRLAGYVTG